jgi:chemotaxis protein methyltransferase CheR
LTHHFTSSHPDLRSRWWLTEAFACYFETAFRDQDGQFLLPPLHVENFRSSRRKLRQLGRERFKQLVDEVIHSSWLEFYRNDGEAPLRYAVSWSILWALQQQMSGSVEQRLMQVADLDDDEISVEDIEIRLLLEAIYQMYGYDFRSYSKASIRRRVMHRMTMSGFASIMEMTDKVLRDRPFFVTLLNDLTVNVTEMYRDPEFYRAFRDEVVPVLKTFPFIKIWHAGCSTGEEIYSMAILLEEEGLYDRAMIYATDIDKNVLASAKKGIYSIEAVKQYGDNYRRAGGRHSLSDYFTARYDSVIMEQRLKRNIVFADHDLATDQVFGEMHVILCRNVLIYFDRALQARVIRLFSDSLDMGGYLCLGTKESLRFSGQEETFDVINKPLRIFRKRQLLHHA